MVTSNDDIRHLDQFISIYREAHPAYLITTHHRQTIVDYIVSLCLTVVGRNPRPYCDSTCKKMLFISVLAPLSPSTARRLGYNRNLRTASVELPDEVDKSLSSASTSPLNHSPCSSPGRQNLAVNTLRVSLSPARLSDVCCFFFSTESTSSFTDQFICSFIQLQSTPRRRIGLNSWF